MSSTKPRSADIHPGPGFRVRLDFHRCDPEAIQQFRKFEVPDISDALNRLYALDASIHLMTDPSHVLCGSACTVRAFPGDNLMVHKSLDVAKPGDVVVIAAQGMQCANAVLGDIICTKARHRKIAGFIVDGMVRDLPAIRQLDIPVFARAATSIGPLHRGPGELNYPIACGGVVINPGDIIVADASGIVAIPQETVSELLRRMEDHQMKQEVYLDAVQRGEFSNAWVDQLLDEHECPITE